MSLCCGQRTVSGAVHLVKKKTSVEKVSAAWAENASGQDTRRQKAVNWQRLRGKHLEGLVDEGGWFLAVLLRAILSSAPLLPNAKLTAG